MKEYIIDGAKMLSRAEAYAEIARAMEFPEYFGENLDALWDMIAAMAGNVKLVSVADMLNALGAYGCRMLAVFYDAAEENDNLEFKAE